MFAYVAALAGLGCSRPETSSSGIDRSDGRVPEFVVPAVAAGSIRIDGRLDDWPEAPSTGAFVSPGDGRPVSRSKVPASARLARDDTRLLLAVEVHDVEASSPFGRDEVDPHIWERASGVELMLQPGDGGDNRDYFEVQICAAGAVWDTRFDDYNQPVTGSGAARRYGHQEWQSGAERAVSVEPGRWVVELALPFASLAPSRAALPPRPNDVWRANLYAFRDGQREASAWSPILGQGNFHRSTRWGRLRF